MNKPSKTIVEYRTAIPPHWDYSNPEGRAWILKDGTKVSKGDKQSHSLDVSKYEVKHFTHKFEEFSSEFLKKGNTLSKHIIEKLEAPGYYYTICPKNYLYDDLGVLTKSILWDKPQFSYLDILEMFSIEIKKFLKENKNNVCIIEKRFSQDNSSSEENNKYIRYNGEFYFILSDSDSEKDIMQALEEHTNQEGEGIIVLTNIENVNNYLQHGKTADEIFFYELSKKSFRLYYPIYDNESFMVLETPPPLRLFTRLHIKPSDIDRIEKRHWELDCDDEMNPFPLPDILIIEKDIQPEPAGFMMYRYTNDEIFAGDTWHENLEDTKHQAEFEYGGCLEDWKEIPKDVKDSLKYVIDLDKKN